MPKQCTTVRYAATPHSPAIVTFGEIMLRLSPPLHERLFQSPVLQTTFGGSEANVAASLAIFGAKSAFITALPDNPIGEAARRFLSSFGVDVRAVIKPSRMGIYFNEMGACQRPSKVIYDRDMSAAATAVPEDYGFDKRLEGASWFHVSGVTPAISQAAADSALAAVKAAKAAGITVSLDLNYRAKLWKYGKNNIEVMRGLAKYADVIIANEEDIQKSLGIALDDKDTANTDETMTAKSTAVADSEDCGGTNTAEKYKTLCKKVKHEFPNVSRVAVTLRKSISADVNGWQAVLDGKDGFFASHRYEIRNIVDRLGAGDSFAAGLIYAINEWGDEERALEFAAAASCLKHSIPGDFNLATKQEVEFLMAGGSDGRIQR